MVDRSSCGFATFNECNPSTCERQCSATIWIPPSETPLGRQILKSRLTLLLALGLLIPFLAISAIAGAETWPNVRNEHAPV